MLCCAGVAAAGAPGRSPHAPRPTIAPPPARGRRSSGVQSGGVACASMTCSTFSRVAVAVEADMSQGHMPKLRLCLGSWPRSRQQQRPAVPGCRRGCWLTRWRWTLPEPISSGAARRALVFDLGGSRQDLVSGALFRLPARRGSLQKKKGRRITSCVVETHTNVSLCLWCICERDLIKLPVLFIAYALPSSVLVVARAKSTCVAISPLELKMLAAPYHPGFDELESP